MHVSAPLGKGISLAFFFTLFLTAFTCFSQEQTFKQLTFRIDSLAARGLPKSALVQVEKLDRLARINKNTPNQVKATFYRLTFLSQISENAQVAVIRQLEKDVATATWPVKPVLQSALAEVYLLYYHQNRFQFSQRSQLSTPSPDFTQWDLRTLFQQVSHLHQAALTDSAGLQKTPAGILGEALLGDKTTRPLRPTLYDLLAHRALEFFLSGEAALPMPKEVFLLNDPLYFSDSRTFSNLKLPQPDTSASLYKGFKILQQAARFHLSQNNTEALADLDLKRLQAVFQRSPLPARDSLYLSGLHQVAQSFREKPISADALFLTGQYYQQRDSLVMALTFFDQAFERFPQSLGGRNAASARADIRAKSISAELEDVVPAQRPILASVAFKNLSGVKTTLYKLTDKQLSQLLTIRSQISNNPQKIESVKAPHRLLAFLAEIKALQLHQVPLPDPGDHRSHRAEFKIDALQPGDYVLLLQGGSRQDTTLMQVATFKVSNLAYTSRINPDGKLELRVMNRKHGQPIAGARVIVNEKVWVGNSSQTRKIAEGLSDNAGRVLFQEAVQNKQLSVSLLAGGDMLLNQEKYAAGARRQDHGQDQVVERTILFTDRQIYRPGQTIYFKGLQVKKTNAKNALVTGKALEVTFSDVNNKTIGTLAVKTNAFGTFSGSFQVPTAVLTGQVSIRTGHGELGLQVEAYKRPSFQISFEPVKETYQLNDSVTVKGQVLAFAGYGLTKAKIQYKVIRQSVYMPYYNQPGYNPSRFNRMLPREEMAIQSGILTADADGRFEIRFKALAALPPGFPGQQYGFVVSTAITDAAGESQEAATTVQVGQNPLTLQLTLPAQLILPDTLKAQLLLTNLNGQQQPGKVLVELFPLIQPDRVYSNRLWEKPDVNAWQKSEFEKEFPNYAPFGQEDFRDWPLGEKIFSQTYNSTAGQATPLLIGFSSREKAGIYLVLARGFNEQGDSITIKNYITLVSKTVNSPATIGQWVIPLKREGKPGEKALFLVGAGKSQVLVEVYNGPELISSEWVETGQKQKLVEIPVKAGYGSQLRVQFMMTADNRLYAATHQIKMTDETPELALKFTTFRDKLTPGEKETWKLQVRDFKDKALAAEMVASLYDASLDKIAPPHSWTSPFEQMFNIYSPDYFAWQHWNFVKTVNTQPLKYQGHTPGISVRNYEQLNKFGFNFNGSQLMMMRTESAPGIQIRGNAAGNDARALEEVAVAGYANQQKSDVTGAVAAVMADAEVNQSAPVPAPLQAQPITIRRNLQETAFFYPHLRTDEKGEISLEFTVPEALTLWQFKGLAHTTELQWGYLEGQVVTQKMVMVSPTLPRFFREGDTITVSARVANLSTEKLSGKVKLSFLDALTNQPLPLLTKNSAAAQDFSLAAGTTGAVSFTLAIPANISAVTYRITAETGNYSDGEENTLPVLPNAVLVTESLPMLVRPGQTKTFTLNKLLNPGSSTIKNQSLTFEFTQNPVWSVVQALPYLMEYPYACTEQIFSSYYANTLAAAIVQKSPLIRQVFARWQATDSQELLSNLEKNQELKQTLLTETPWLREAGSETEQKKRIAILFDLNKMEQEQAQNLDKLADLQFADGSFPWFAGMPADRYISRHILAGFGQLEKLGLTAPASTQHMKIREKALAYLDQAIIRDETQARAYKKTAARPGLSADQIHTWFTRSYFTDKALSPQLQQAWQRYQQLAAAGWPQQSTYEKGLIALTMHRYKQPLLTKQIIRSLLETSQQSQELGMYWPQNQVGYFWYQAPTETQVLLIELFTETKQDSKLLAEMKIWLLRHKQTNNWRSTKATAAACYALLLRGEDWLPTPAPAAITLGGQPLETLKPDLDASAGSGYIKTSWAPAAMKPAFGQVAIKNDGHVASWGALHWQYLEKADKITAADTQLKLRRQYFIRQTTDGQDLLVPVDARHLPKVGDVLKVVIYLESDREMEYVQLKDLRPAGTEPTAALSGYKFQDGLHYYQSTRDAATNFFISRLAKGKYVFEYQLRVSQPGNFATGISTIQSMYAPEFNAHSEGSRIQFGK